MKENLKAYTDIVGGLFWCVATGLAGLAFGAALYRSSGAVLVLGTFVAVVACLIGLILWIGRGDT